MDEPQTRERLPHRMPCAVCQKNPRRDVGNTCHEAQKGRPMARSQEPNEMNFEWMNGSVKPSRPGVYPVKDAHGTAARYFARWTGTVWNVACASQARALLVNAESKYQNRQWRQWATDVAA
jgi:hypothetical protein